MPLLAHLERGPSPRRLELQAPSLDLFYFGSLSVKHEDLQRNRLLPTSSGQRSRLANRIFDRPARVWFFSETIWKIRAPVLNPCVGDCAQLIWEQRIGGKEASRIHEKPVSYIFLKNGGNTIF